MTKLDPELTSIIIARRDGGARAMHERGADPLSAVTFAADASESDDNPDVRLIVRYSGHVQPLVDAGLRHETVAGNIATGSIKISDLEALDQVDELDRAEAAIRLQTSLDLSMPETRANLVHAGPPGMRGSGIVVGIVDSGVDFTHGNFRDSSGNTRILRIWDQNLSPQVGENNPSGFSYGVEWDDAAINAALGTPNPFNSVRHQDVSTHGTHVAGIAVGDGSMPGNGEPADTYIGVAPEADIVAVGTDLSSAGIIDGVNYVFRVADTLGRPAVVNLSLGSVIGPHDGTSNFEQGITNLITGQGKVVVAASGNEASDNARASGTVNVTTPTTLNINVPNGRNARVVLDLWYDGADVFGVNLTDPGGNSTGNVAVGSNFNGPLGGNPTAVFHENNDPNNGDKRIVVIMEGGGGNVTNGVWQLQLTGVTVGTGRFDTWINNPRGQPVVRFLNLVSQAGTVASPATANRVIIAGSYITRGAGVGSISAFSNRGPTRDGRPAPDIAAPGQRIISANRLVNSEYRPASGTSMATPHVSGTVALMLQQNRDRTWQQIRDCLRNTARNDTFTGTTPNNAWGWGKMDSQAAVACVRPLVTRPPVCPVPTHHPTCSLMTRPPICLTRPPLCPPLTRFGCPPPTRGNCPPLTRFGCPPPTRGNCPPLTRFGCPPLTRVGCPPDTRIGCPPGSRLGCPVPSRTVCGRPGLTDRGMQEFAGYPSEYGQDWYGDEEYYDPADYYGHEQAGCYDETYMQGFQEGYAQAYEEAFGTYSEAADQPTASESSEQPFYDYDDQWFDPDEFK